MVKNAYFSIFLAFFLALSALGVSVKDAQDDKVFKMVLRMLDGRKYDVFIKLAEMSYKNMFTYFELSPEDYFFIFAGKMITDQQIFDARKKEMDGDNLFFYPYKRIEIVNSNGLEKTFVLTFAGSTLESLKTSLRKQNEGLGDCPLFFDGNLLETDEQLQEALKPGTEKRISIDFSSSLEGIKRQQCEAALDLAKKNLMATPWRPTMSNNQDYDSVIGIKSLGDIYPFVPQNIAEYPVELDEETAKHEIFPNFFVGNVSSTFLALYGPGAGEFSIFNFFPLDGLLEAAQAQAQRKGIDYRQIRVLDNENAFLDLEENNLQQNIKDALLSGKKVLIACQMGVSRSVSIAILFLMNEFKLNVIQAYRVIKNVRACAKPNLGFLVGLVEHEKDHPEINRSIAQGIGEEWLSNLLETKHGQKDKEIIEMLLANSSSCLQNAEGQIVHIFKQPDDLKYAVQAYYWDLVSMLRVIGINFSVELLEDSSLKVTIL